MTRADKEKIVEELKEKFNNRNHFYFTDASGLSVAQVNKLRRLAFESGIEYKVVKNTLIRKALEQVEREGDFSQLEDSLKGFSGIMFADVGNAPAKLIKKFRKDGPDKPTLKAAVVDTDFYIGEDKLTDLDNLKTKEDVIAEIIGLLQSPAKNVISSLQSGKHKLAGIVKTLSEKEEK